MMQHPIRTFFSILFIGAVLAGLYLFWQIRQHGSVQALREAVNVLPVSSQQKTTLETALSLGDYFLSNDGKERTFLVLFQNNWELRPGGGFIGSFGIVKVKNGEITAMDIHDTGNFDGRIPSTVQPPYPMAQTLHIDSWKLRDSNFSPDFPTNATQAEYFYKLGQGEEYFDGIIGVTTNLLTSLLEITGPITLPGYPGTYAKEDAIYTLEYQVEVGYREQGIAKGDRKSIMRDLAQAIREKLEPLDAFTKLKLAQLVLSHLETKDIQLYFKDEKLQRLVEEKGWAGRVDESWNKDYLFMVDANLGAWKSDYFVKRQAEYVVDLSKEVPTATLTITYHHTAPKRDWRTTHYRTYLRVYAPQGSWLAGTKNLEDPVFGKEFNKTSFGFLVDVPLTEQKTVSLTYTLPQEIVRNYDLKLQKQAGVSNIPVNVRVIAQDGSSKDYALTMNSDVLLSSL